MRPPCCDDVRGAELHCVGCHQSFRSLGLFDRHQDVNYSREKAVRHRSPPRMGLVQDARGVWCTPEGLKAAASKRKQLAKARLARAS